MANADQSQRFMFEETEVRGELVGLAQSYRKLLSQHNYPAPVSKLLGEFMSAAVLMASTIKFDGSLILQCKGTGQISTLMVEVVNKTQIRGVARITDDFDENGTLIGDGQLAITIEPDNGARYQGIVLVKDNNLAASLEQYFEQSEQIRTRIWLQANEQYAAGMLIQAMPRSAHESSLTDREDATWEHLVTLADTTTADELIGLENEQLLYRLYHEEKVRMFEPRELEFKCSCSRERVGNSLLSVGYQECSDIIAEQQKISIDCQFCSQHYSFNHDDIEQLFNDYKQSLN